MYHTNQALSYTHTHSFNEGCLLSRAALVLVIAGDLVVAANLVYLAYAMYYVLEELCLVCVTLDTVHLLLLAVHVHQYCNMEGRQKKKEE